MLIGLKVLDEISARGVVSGSLDHRYATGWIYNPVIVQKRYSKEIYT